MQFITLKIHFSLTIPTSLFLYAYDLYCKYFFFHRKQGSHLPFHFQLSSFSKFKVSLDSTALKILVMTLKFITT